jgi:hypothetical protein
MCDTDPWGAKTRRWWCPDAGRGSRGTPVPAPGAADPGRRRSGKIVCARGRMIFPVVGPAANAVTSGAEATRGVGPVVVRSPRYGEDLPSRGRGLVMAPAAMSGGTPGHMPTPRRTCPAAFPRPVRLDNPGKPSRATASMACKTIRANPNPLGVAGALAFGGLCARWFRPGGRAGGRRQARRAPG